MVNKADSGRWQLAFWVVTVGVFGSSLMGYFNLDKKIEVRASEIKEEKKSDINTINNRIGKVDDKIEKLDDKIDDIVKEQTAIRTEQNKKFTDILIVLEQIKAKQNE